MKKVLNILSAVTLVSAGTSSAVACKDNDVITSKDKNYSENKVNDISLAQDLIDNSGNSVAIIAINNSNQ
ncbi:lipoprotein, partial [Spiroplasma endosymbiont of Megaselia nigra]|uniref:lipoprotein n=1 Tax=Spiroplasma endosymbiont of Megaselia nigra TaxID=2478537 RepID=UPI000FBFC39F